MLRRSLILVAALAAVSVARRRGAVVVGPAAAAFPITIQAANGDVVIKARPTRIVSLSPTATEDLFAVGAGAQVDRGRRPVGLPEARAAHEALGLHAERRGDRLVQPRPRRSSRTTAASSPRSRSSASPCCSSRRADNVAQAYDQIRQIGRATGHEPTATTARARRCRRTLTALIRSVPKKSRHLKVYHELDPTTTRRRRRRSSAASTGSSGSATSPTPPTRRTPATRSSRPSTSSRRTRDIVVLADSICCGQTPATRRGAARLERDRGGAQAPRRRDRRQRRVALGAAHRRLRARRSPRVAKRS